MLETVLAGLAYAAPYVKNISIRVGERPRKDRDATRVTRPDAGRARCYLTSIFCTRVHDCTSPRAKRLPKLRATTLPTATLTQTSPRLRLMPLALHATRLHASLRRSLVTALCDAAKLSRRSRCLFQQVPPSRLVLWRYAYGRAAGPAGRHRCASCHVRMKPRMM